MQRACSAGQDGRHFSVLSSSTASSGRPPGELIAPSGSRPPRPSRSSPAAISTPPRGGGGGGDPIGADAGDKRYRRHRSNCRHRSTLDEMSVRIGSVMRSPCRPQGLQATTLCTEGNPNGRFRRHITHVCATFDVRHFL